tara:strand:+ start:498 stop:995 length:498 start_codon:yes stop_codon:yes gene_type:complete
MSEELNPRELPHEMLMRKYGLGIDKMSNHTKQLKKDLDRALQLVLNKSKNGAVKLTPATQQKIETYDRYICDGIFEYLENQEVITEEESQKVEDALDDKREEVKEKMEDMHEEAKEKAETQATPSSSETTSSEETPQSTSNTETPPPTESKGDGGSVKIGFWDWK